LIGKDEKELRKQSNNLIFGFNNGYVRPKWKTGFGPCRSVEITFYKDNPIISSDTSFISLIDAPVGKLKYFDATKNNALEDGYVFMLDTIYRQYIIVCRSDDGEHIDRILISIHN
jgi:hypothetical protein